MPTDDAPQSLTDLAGLLAGPDPKDDNEGDPPEVGTTPADPPAADEGDTADEATADEGTDGGGADDDDADEGDGVSTEPVYTVKIDGKDHQVNLKEALAGYQRNADYTRKTQEVAEQRKQLEAAVSGANQQREQYGQVLKVILERLGPEEGELNAEQWNTLRQTDPGRYATEWTDYQRRQQQRDAVKVEQGRIASARQADQVSAARTYLEGERTKLVAALPDFGHAEKAPAAMKATREYAAKTFGFSEAEMDKAYDHRMIVAINKAMQWDNHMASLKTAKTKIQAAPQLAPPGARQPAKSAKTLRRAEAQKQFDKSGRIDDAVTLLLT